MDKIDHDMNVGQRPIPVTVLTGFLGAGKTTLLNRILNGDHGLRVAVLVNDFGSINIDADLVVGVENGGDIINLANGCICCSIRDDLVEAVTKTIERPEQPEYILLEASGVAEPAGIAGTFLSPNFRDRIRLDSITCVVDAEQVLAVPELMELKLRQIAFSDMLLLNKVDLVDQAQRDKIKAWLGSRLYRYRLIEASHCDVPIEILLSVGRFDPAQFDPCPSPLGGERVAEGMVRDEHHDYRDAHCNHEHHGRDHAQSFSTWGYETGRPLSLEALRETVSRLPNSIYRAKGVVYCADVPERRVVLQVVGKRVDITLEEPWGERTPRTRIVAIGAPGSIDKDALRERFEQCLGGAVGLQ